MAIPAPLGRQSVGKGSPAVSAAAAGLEVTEGSSQGPTAQVGKPGQHWYLQPKQLPQVPLGSGSQRRWPSAKEARW